MRTWLDRFVDWVYAEPKPKEPEVRVHYEWLKMQGEREGRQDDWRRKFEQQQIDSDYWWAYVEMRREGENQLLERLHQIWAEDKPKSRYYDLWSEGYVYGLLINPIYRYVHESAKYKDGGTNIHKQYEEWMESLRPNSTWDWIDQLRKQIKTKHDEHLPKHQDNSSTAI